jgi:hypothetical protein
MKNKIGMARAIEELNKIVSALPENYETIFIKNEIKLRLEDLLFLLTKE